MFGVAHVHHLVEMVKFQGVKLTSAVAVVSTLQAHCQVLAACRIGFVQGMSANAVLALSRASHLGKGSAGHLRLGSKTALM